MPHAPQPTPSGDPVTLSELRRLVDGWRRLPGDMLVVLAKDRECNRHSPLDGFTLGHYAPDSPDSQKGEVYPMAHELANDQELRALYPEGIPPTARLALVLVPLG
ncbi:hypothetical protein [Streptomyces flavofungini]|uniref:Uncharacterized protein n=1 Tax=Streptomyces flavofungini TaxID=68200 RepID=A0ABS0XH55_9ACTN|nr:hypothetical protein [Streptomyces flavofungini]MBJ3812311.1 hypothetical protein [Streptomyces flavofungini]GHC88529.1 hypothetical protein GCM10010349_75870 [Streptomyces flavofungini]